MIAGMDGANGCTTVARGAGRQCSDIIEPADRHGSALAMAERTTRTGARQGFGGDSLHERDVRATNPASHLGKVPDAIQMAEQGAAELLQDSDLDAETRALLCHTNGRVLLALGQFSRALELAVAVFPCCLKKEPAFAETRVELLLLKAEALRRWRTGTTRSPASRTRETRWQRVRDEDARRWLAVRLLDR